MIESAPGGLGSRCRGTGLRLLGAFVLLALASSSLARETPPGHLSEDWLQWKLPGLEAESLRTGLAAETPFLIDGDEISALGVGIEAFFDAGGLIEATDGSLIHGVGLKLEGQKVEQLRWQALDRRGRVLEQGMIEVTWSEERAHVARVLLPQPAARVRLLPGDAQLDFLFAEPLFSLPPKDQVLARDLPLDTTPAEKSTGPSGMITRAQWGARAPRNTASCATAHTPRFLTVHHTATPNNDSLTPAARMRQMQAYHMDNLGWCDYGYHLTVGIDGRIYEGRNPDRVGTHVGNHNTGNFGISVVGTFVNFAPRQAQLDALTAASRWAVNRYPIPRTRTNILGHNEWPGHTSNACPGQLRQFLPTLVQQLNTTSPPPPPPPPPSSAVVLDNFESGVGRFYRPPTWSGSTRGISSQSWAQRSNIQARSGQWSLQVRLVDDPASNQDWFVRLLSGDGQPANNVALQKAGGRLGAWFFTGASGVSVRFLVRDSDGLEISRSRVLPQNQWTFHEVWLDDSSQWTAWVGGNGIITASQVTLDSIVIERAQTSWDVYLYIDDVGFRIQR